LNVHPDGTITQSTFKNVLDNERDELGVPRANLDWRLNALDKRSIRELQKIIGEEVGRSEIGRIRLKEWLQDESAINKDWTLPLEWLAQHGHNAQCKQPKKRSSRCKLQGFRTFKFIHSGFFMFPDIGGGQSDHSLYLHSPTGSPAT